MYNSFVYGNGIGVQGQDAPMPSIDQQRYNVTLNTAHILSSYDIYYINESYHDTCSIIMYIYIYIYYYYYYIYLFLIATELIKQLT